MRNCGYFGFSFLSPNALKLSPGLATLYSLFSPLFARYFYNAFIRLFKRLLKSALNAKITYYLTSANFFVVIDGVVSA